MMMMWEWGNGADSSRVRTSAAGLLESGGERRFGVVLLCLRGLEWNKEKREKKTSRLQHVKAAHVSYMTSVRSLILRWWWQCGDLLLNKFLRFLSLLFVLPFFFFVKGGQKSGLCYSRVVVLFPPAPQTHTTAKRRCLTSNAIFRKNARSLWVTGARTNGVLWSGKRRSSSVRNTSEPIALEGLCTHKRWMELLRVYFRVQCMFMCRLNGWNGECGEV